MKKDDLRLYDYLGHILEAIDRIGRYTDEMDEEKFITDELTQDAVIRNIEIIGEASRNIEKRYPEFSVKHPDLPLSIAYEMRNALAHGYFKVDIKVVWKTIQSDLPDLGSRIKQLRKDIAGK